jgi:hypothetical protein
VLPENYVQNAQDSESASSQSSGAKQEYRKTDRLGECSRVCPVQGWGQVSLSWRMFKGVLEEELGLGSGEGHCGHRGSRSRGPVAQAMSWRRRPPLLLSRD